MDRIIVATTNEGKIREIKELFKPLNIEVLMMNEVLDKPLDIEENGKDFKENALIKAKALKPYVKDLILADDSGLVIDALNGKPGIESARFMGHDTSYSIKNKKILEMMEGKMNRSARFVCAMALIIPQKEPIIVEETFEGEIATKIEGENGFGYDPIFYYPPLHKTSAMMTLEEKNQYSHRAKALLKVFEILYSL